MAANWGEEKYSSKKKRIILLITLGQDRNTNSQSEIQILSNSLHPVPFWEIWVSYKMVIKANHDRFSTLQQGLEVYQSKTGTKSITEQRQLILPPLENLLTWPKSKRKISSFRARCPSIFPLTIKWPLRSQGNVWSLQKKYLWTPGFAHHKMLFMLIFIYLGIFVSCFAYEIDAPSMRWIISTWKK